MLAIQLGKHQRHDTEETEQAGRVPKHAGLGAMAWRSQPQMSASLMEGHLNGPRRRVGADNLAGTQAQVRTEKALLAMSALAVADLHPAQWDQSLAAAVPRSRPAHQGHSPLGAAIPGHSDLAGLSLG